MEGFVQFLRDFFVYSHKSPLIFTLHNFWIFFLLVLAIDSLVFRRQKLRSVFLMLVSIFFYYKTSGLFFVLLLISITMDYNIGKKLHHSQNQSIRKFLLGLSVGFNLLLLCYFKYAYFFTEVYQNLSGSHFQVVNYFGVITSSIGRFFAGIIEFFVAVDDDAWQSFVRFKSDFKNSGFFNVNSIVLPVGISFYTFQTISYTIEIYRRNLEPARNYFDFGFYVSFFPQLVAGPIVRASEFIPQIYKPYSLSKQEFGMGLFWILNGLVKKVFIGDYIATNFIDRVYANPTMYTGFENFLAVIAYSLQVYCDFSGYTDIAIGLALIMGFHLTQNFNSPYKAANVGDFWRRWHISLSNWLRDYLYIPLGGNKKSTPGTLIWLIILGIFVFSLSIAYNTFSGVNLFVDATFGDVIIMICAGILSLFAPLAILVFLLSSKVPALKKGISTDINLMITMLLGGLWHGSNWLFVIWGGLNGLALVFYKQWKKVSFISKLNHPAVHVYSIAITFLFISFTRIFFRSAATANPMLTARDVMNQMWYAFNWTLVPQTLWAHKTVMLFCLIGFVFHWLPQSLKDNYKLWFANTKIWLKVVICVMVVFIIYQSTSSELQPFIYFQF